MRISDWSSDVCSSDLGKRSPRKRKKVADPLQAEFMQGSDRYLRNPERRHRQGLRNFPPALVVHDTAPAEATGRPGKKSEERRVGKEGVSTCRTRSCTYH